MQRLPSSDSLGDLISSYPSKADQRNEKIGDGGRVYSREFQAMLDNLESEDCAEESVVGSEKKRRLSSHQVRALEKYFELENKLEPERKAKLAEELGLQPRQVAIWFQNRRARWKTKQLERDFGLLKANYDSLKLDFNALRQEKEALSAEVRELKSKLQRQNVEESQSPAMPDSADNMISSEQSRLIDETATKVYNDFKDNGSSDSDSNGIYKDESDVNNAQLQMMSSPSPSIQIFPNFGGSSSSAQEQPVMSWCQLPDLRMMQGRAAAAAAAAQQEHIVKMEEESMFSSEESCYIYSVDQPPTLHWYFSDQ